jgi:hypothetical protein
VGEAVVGVSVLIYQILINNFYSNSLDLQLELNFRSMIILCYGSKIIHDRFIKKYPKNLLNSIYIMFKRLLMILKSHHKTGKKDYTTCGIFSSYFVGLSSI